MLEVRVQHIWMDTRLNTTLLKRELEEGNGDGAEELEPAAISQFWVPDSYFHHVKDAKFNKLLMPTASLRIYANQTLRYSTM